MSRPNVKVFKIQPSSVRDQLRKTISLVARGIREGSTYFPIRQHAAAIAATAAPKDYMGQLAALYDDFTTRRWKYVKDPLLSEMVHVSGPAIWHNVWGAASGQGTGDCDCATSAFGAAAASIGFPVRIVTSTAPKARKTPLGRLPGHIYPEVFVKGYGWIPADPVVYPKNGLGHAPEAIARQRWDLWGKPIAGAGDAGTEGGATMLGEEYEGLGLEVEGYDLTDYGYAGFAGDGEEPLRWEVAGPEGFGAYADTMGILGGFGLEVEGTPDARGLIRTPMLELHPRDFLHMKRHGRPYHGMAALGDDGQVYQWDGFGGFFKKLFKRIGKGVKKVVGKVRKVARKIIKKLPGGKYLIKFVDKIHKVAMKLVRPLARFVGKYASKLAPIAAMIPGYGPAISAALHVGGKITKMMDKFGVLQDKKGKLHFPKGPKQAKAFKGALKEAAAHERQEFKAGRKPKFKGHMPAGSPAHARALKIKPAAQKKAA